MDLASEELEEPTAPLSRGPSIIDRLRTFDILPPAHATLPEHVLEQIEELFVTWYRLADDEARREVLSSMFGSEADCRRVLLAVVPLYFDSLLFDGDVPTRELVSILLVAHAKWRRWLGAS
jgi:hypothetical protein